MQSAKVRSAVSPRAILSRRPLIQAFLASLYSLRSSPAVASPLPPFAREPYFWEYTDNAYDFGNVLNTPIAFPIAWRESKLDGLADSISTINIHGFQWYTTMGRSRARYFPPETGGPIFHKDAGADSVFRIDHDQAFQQTTDLRYQRGNGVWAPELSNRQYRCTSGQVICELAPKRGRHPPTSTKSARQHYTLPR